MPRTEAGSKREGQGAVAAWARRIVVFAGLAACGGCASGGLGLDALGVDTAITTGSVTRAADGPSDAEKRSDEDTIRDAVSSANLDRLPGGSIAWANSFTGSRGEITAITEHQQDGRLCRRFRVSRESFEGVALYRGEACLVIADGWRMRAFDAV